MEPKSDVKLFNGNDEKFVENLILEGDFVEFNPNEKNNRETHPPQKEIRKNSGKRSRKDIYDEFWEFIDDRNKDFQEFIENDKRRVKLRIGII